jgi:hypothetical protein
MGTHERVFFSVKSQSCAGAEGTLELSRVRAAPKPVMVVFGIARMRLIRLGS